MSTLVRHLNEVRTRGHEVRATNGRASHTSAKRRPAPLHIDGPSVCHTLRLCPPARQEVATEYPRQAPFTTRPPGWARVSPKATTPELRQAKSIACCVIDPGALTASTSSQPTINTRPLVAPMPASEAQLTYVADQSLPDVQQEPPPTMNTTPCTIDTCMWLCGATAPYMRQRREAPSARVESGRGRAPIFAIATWGRPTENTPRMPSDGVIHRTAAHRDTTRDRVWGVAGLQMKSGLASLPRVPRQCRSAASCMFVNLRASTCRCLCLCPPCRK